MAITLARDRGHKRQQTTTVQVKKKNYKIIPTPCPPTHTLIQIKHPPSISSSHHLKQEVGGDLSVCVFKVTWLWHHLHLLMYALWTPLKVCLLNKFDVWNCSTTGYVIISKSRYNFFQVMPLEANLQCLT